MTLRRFSVRQTLLLQVVEELGEESAALAIMLLGAPECSCAGIPRSGDLRDAEQGRKGRGLGVVIDAAVELTAYGVAHRGVMRRVSSDVAHELHGLFYRTRPQVEARHAVLPEGFGLLASVVLGVPHERAPYSSPSVYDVAEAVADRFVVPAPS